MGHRAHVHEAQDTRQWGTGHTCNSVLLPNGSGWPKWVPYVGACTETCARQPGARQRVPALYEEPGVCQAAGRKARMP